MDKVFLDTSALKALIDPDDTFHKQAINIFKNLKQEKIVFVTSNFILDESYTVVRSKCSLAAAVKLRELVESEIGSLKVYRILINDELDAWKWFEKDWNSLSFTDCVSFVQLERLKIKRVFSFDKHFKRAGFDIESESN